MLRRKYRVLAAAILALVIVTPLITVGTASAASVSDLTGVTAATAKGQVLGSCPSAFTLVKKVQMKDGSGHLSPGVIWIYLGPGNESACAVLNRLNQANGVADNTAITIQSASGAVAHQDGVNKYYAGYVTLPTPGCFDVRGAMRLGKEVYKWDSGMSWCGNKDANFVFDNEPRDNPRTVTQAIAWAKSQINNPTPPAGHSDWHNDCLGLVARAYGWMGGSGLDSALLEYQKEPASKQHAGDTTPPVGALVFWHTSNPHGHVAIYIGNGNVVSTDMPSDNGEVGIVSLASVSTRWNAHYVGWADPYFMNGSVG